MHIRQILTPITICCVAWSLLTASFSTPPQTATAQTQGHASTLETLPADSPTLIHDSRQNTETNTSLYLPLLLRSEPIKVKLGAQVGTDVRLYYTNTAKLTGDLTTIHTMGSRWFRFDVPWNEIETEPNVYDWTAMDEVFSQVLAAGLSPLPNIWSAPEWTAELDCGPIDDIESFENFLEALTDRYGDNVDAWEFANEPDAREPHPWGPVIGCWGLQPQEYADQLGIFYRAIKELDPGALVISGGIAHDNWPVFERSFWEETMAAGAGNYFDVANFHYYPINPKEFPSIVDKIERIRDAMEANGVFNRRIWITETAMWTNLNGSVEIQRNFIVQEQARGLAAGVDNIFWFSPRELEIDPERHVNAFLFTTDHQPLTGFATYQFFASKVQGTIVTRGAVPNLPADIEAYHFRDTGRENRRETARDLTIAWSNGEPQTVIFNTDINATISSRDGDSVTTIEAQDGQVAVEVGAQPIYIEFIE